MGTRASLYLAAPLLFAALLFAGTALSPRAHGRAQGPLPAPSELELALAGIERGYWNGRELHQVAVDATRVSVRFSAALDAGAVRAVLLALPRVDAARAAGLEVSDESWTYAPLVPGTTAQEAIAFARWLDALPDVVFAMPVVSRTGETLGLTNQLQIALSKPVTRDAAAALFAAEGLRVVEELAFVEHGYTLELPKGSERDTVQVSTKLYELGIADWCVPDFHVRRELRDTPNDTYFQYQWHLNTGSFATGSLGVKADADIDATEAWDVEPGDPAIRVCIIDDGVEYTHEDLSPAWVGGWDYLSGDSNPFPGTSDFHGTAVAGVAAARGNNAKGVSGVARLCSLQGVRLVGFGQTTAKEASAFTWAANNGADVINCSWGPPDGTGQSQPLPANVKAAIDYCVTSGRGGKGCAIFFAAGNGSESADLDGYASYANVISVAASTDQDLHASYSDTGSSVDVAAPSSGGAWLGVVTTDRTGSAGYYSISYTPNFGGTSSSSPCAAGVGALVLSKNPDLTYSQVRQVLVDTAVEIDPAGGGWSGGFSAKYGNGKVDADGAVAAAGTPGGGGGGGSTAIFVSSDVPKSIPDNNAAGVYSNVTVSGLSGSVVDLDVTVNLTHTYKGDLELHLVRPDGAFIKLHDNTGGSADNIITTYDTQTAPAQPLSGLFGGPPAGTWRLRAIDLAAQDVGQINSWSLLVKTDVVAPPPPPPPPPTTQTGTWSTSQVPKAIPDNSSAGVFVEITVPAAGTILEVDCAVNVTHTYKGDLVLYLQRPDGQYIQLKASSNDSADNVITTWDTLTQPVQPMSNLSGGGVNGVWRFWAFDVVAQDVGQINSCSITVKYQ